MKRVVEAWLVAHAVLVVFPACPAVCSAAVAGHPRDRPSGIPHPPGRRRPKLECVSATRPWADEEIAPCRGGGPAAPTPSAAAQADSLTVTVIRVSNPDEAQSALTSSSFSGAQEIATLSLSAGSTVDSLFAMLSLSPTLYTVSFTGQVRNCANHAVPASCCFLTACARPSISTRKVIGLWTATVSSMGMCFWCGGNSVHPRAACRRRLLVLLGATCLR